MKKTHAITAAVAVLMFTACKNSDFEGYTKAENGLHYKFFNQNEDAAKAQEGEGISIRYTLKIKSKDSTIFDSKMSSPDGVNKLMLMKSTVYGGIEDALKMMAKGDSAEFILNSDSFFLKTNGMRELPPFLKSGDNLVFSVKMVEVRSKKELEENQKMQMAEQEAQAKAAKEKEDAEIAKYLADNKLTGTTGKGGLIYIETKKGNGPKAVVGDVVKVKYTGSLLNGTVFDTSEEDVAKKSGLYQEGRPFKPLEIALGQTPPRVIAGWEEGLLLMNKGSKGKLIVPFFMGYGPQGNGPIPAFAPLVFEMEIVDILPGAAATQAPAQPGQ